MLAPAISSRSRTSLFIAVSSFIALLLLSSYLRNESIGRAHADAESLPAANESSTISVYASGRGNPSIRLADGRDVTTSYLAAPHIQQLLEQNLARPQALASADYDEDGVPDLVGGYASPSGGIVTLQRGNVDAIYPNAPEAQQRRASGEFTDSAFLPQAAAFELPEAADFIGAGDFDADGHWDVVTAQRGGSTLWMLAGDGRGNLGEARPVGLPGRVTALIVGEINRSDGLADVVVGIVGSNGAKALVFEGPEGAFKAEPEAFSLPAEAISITLGRLDSDYTVDLAVAAGRELVVVYGRDRKLSLDEIRRAEVPKAKVGGRGFSFELRSVAVGDFNGDQKMDMSLLSNEGGVYLLSEGDAKGKKKKSGGVEKWKSEELARGSWGQASKMVCARISSTPVDNLAIVDTPNHQLHIIVGRSSQQAQAAAVQKVTLDVEGEPVAVLPMRLNVDALSDLVIARSGQSKPSVVLTPQAVLAVNSTGDASDTNPGDGVCDVGGGVCTLRAAIQESKALAGLDTITFSIGAGPQTITPLSELPNITDPVVIDGTTQPGFAGTPIIELNGSTIAASGNGLIITAGSSTVRGLVINRFSDLNSVIGGLGILLEFNGSNIIEGNFIGTDITGTTALGNEIGVIIGFSSSPNNLVGGTALGARNIISGNLGTGVQISQPSTGNQVQGNYIGTDVTGTIAIGNAGFGVGGIGVSSPNNIIGGTTAGAGNVISGNFSHGVTLSGNANTVQGNLIGTDATGTLALPNNLSGISIAGNTINNTIGGSTVAARNIISGNLNLGVRFGGNGVTGNIVQGNFIGTDITGTTDLGNVQHGVGFFDAPGNTIGGVSSGARNIISGNNANGVFISGPGATGNQVQGNFIGTDTTGTFDLGNTAQGVLINNAPNNIIGGSGTGTRNIVSGNNSGIRLENGSSGIQVQGNFIGTDVTGTAAIGNTFNGVVVDNSSSNIIGGTTAGSGNLISGNGSNGVNIFTITANANVIQGNLIGTDVTGTSAIGNLRGVQIVGSSNILGGTTPGASNVISGNGGGGGVGIFGSNNIIQKNFIGTDITGALPLANQQVGLFISQGGGMLPPPQDNLVGGTTPDAGNIIAFNSPNAIVLFPLVGANNRILSNSVFSNNGLGIDIGFDGVTGNDPGDNDTGPNNLQNFPVLNSAANSATGTLIQGTLNSTPNTSFTIQFFSNFDCDPSGFGEGQTFIGSRQVITDNTGNVAFTFSTPVNSGNITATATDPAGNTSEFSNCVGIGAASADLELSIAASPDPVRPGANLTYSFTVTNRGPNSSGSFTISDTLPAGTTFVSCSASAGGSCTGSGNNRRVSFLDLAPGASATATFVVTVSSSVAEATRLTNTATLITSTNDPDPTDNSASVITFVSSLALSIICPANLTVSAPAGQTSMTVTYPAPTVADNRPGVSITCTPPSGSPFPLGATSVGCRATDQAGGIATCGFSVTVTATALPDIDFGPPVNVPNSNPPGATFTVTNPGTSPATITIDSILRTGSAVTSGRITSPDDRDFFSLTLVGPGTPLSPGSTVTIGAGETLNFRVVFNPAIPPVGDQVTGLAANRVLPDVVTTLLTLRQGNTPFTVSLTGRVAAALRLIDPDNPSSAPEVTFGRSGNEFILNFAVFDPDLDVSTARYELLDGGGAVVQSFEVNLGQAIQQVNLTRGQSFAVEQRFTGANSHPEVAALRLTVSDGDTSVTRTANLGSLAASAASLRSSQQRRRVSVRLPEARLKDANP